MANVSSKVGKAFEKDFANSCPEEFMLVRLKDGKGYGMNPCDFILLTPYKGIMLELKTTKEKRLARSNIRDHQLEILSMADKLDITSYFVVNFREFDETYLLPAGRAKDYFNTGKKSIPIDWFRENTVRVPQIKKRTRSWYEYAVFD